MLTGIIESTGEVIATEPLDGLVCAPRALFSAGLDRDPSSFRADFERCYFGTLAPLKSTLELLRARAPARLVVVSPLAADAAPVELSARGPAGWALANLCSTLRAELSPQIAVHWLSDDAGSGRDLASLLEGRGARPWSLASAEHLRERLAPRSLDRSTLAKTRASVVEIHRKREVAAIDDPKLEAGLKRQL